MAIGAGSSVQATPDWQRVPGGAIDHRAVAMAAGRFWLVDGPPNAGPVIGRSARATGGRLTGWTAARLGATAARWDFLATFGDELIVAIGTEDPALDTKALRALRMLPNGKLGRPVEVEGAPPPASSNGATVARLRDRVLQPVDAKPQNSIPEYGVCCDVDGNVADYSSFIRTIPLAQPPLLGVDRKGRLWLAWYYRAGSEPYTAWMVGLDPRTLAPRGQPQKASGLRFATIVDMVCADVCRLVIAGSLRSRSSKARAFSWAAGERTPTPLLTPVPFPNVISGYDYKGRLTVAYTAQHPEQGLVLASASGDARGKNLRRGTSVPVPQNLGVFGRGENLTVGPLGVFGPGGFGSFTVYEATRKHTVRAVVLPP